jgi:hypothetical protein
LGQAGDSFNDVITQILQGYKNQSIKENQKLLTTRIVKSKNDPNIVMPANESLATSCKQASGSESQ